MTLAFHLLDCELGRCSLRWTHASPYSVSSAESLSRHTPTQTAAGCLTLLLCLGAPAVQQDSSSCLPGFL